MKNRILPLAVLGLLAAGRADAALIDVTETVTASGTLGGNPFNGALLTITAFANTNNVAQTSLLTYAVNNTSATVSVAGLGTATFTGGTYTYVVQGSNSTVVIGSGTYSSALGDILDTSSSSFSSYNLKTSIGPISGSPTINPTLSFSTSLGSLNITSTSGPVTYQATVAPEPSSVVLAGIGAVMMLGHGWRRRRWSMLFQLRSI